MALVLADRVQQTGTANTTVSFTLTGSVTGFQSFSVIGNGNTTFYSATDTSGNWEVGLGTYSTTGPTLTRTSIFSSSNSGSAVTFSGAVTVFVTYPSGKSVNLDGSGNVSALGTVSSGTWQGSTVGVAYGGTGVTTSSGANSVVLRDANENITVNRINQGLQTTNASGGITVLDAGSDFNQALVGTGGHTFRLPDATTLSDTTTFQFNNNATGTLTIQNNAATTVGTVAPGGAAGIALLSNATVGGTWDVHAYIPENVTWGTNALALGSTVITGGTWNGGTISSAYGGTGLVTFVGANNALYSTSASALAAGTLPVAAGGTGVTSSTGSGSVVLSNSPSLVTPALGTPASGNFTTGSFTWPTFNQNTTGAAAKITGGASGDVVYQTGASTTGFIAFSGSSPGQVLTAGVGAPYWGAAPTPSCATPSAAGIVRGRTDAYCCCGPNRTALGGNAGLTSQGNNSVAIGARAGTNTQGGNAVAIGLNAGSVNQGAGSTVIGAFAGAFCTPACTTVIGPLFFPSAGAGVYITQIGSGCGASCTNKTLFYCTTSSKVTYATAGGGATSATPTVAGIVFGKTELYSCSLGATNRTAVGSYAGDCNQGSYSVAVGGKAAQFSQGNGAVAVGTRAGRCFQGGASVAIGNNAGKGSQGSNSVAVGNAAGCSTQGAYSVAVGVQAGFCSQGQYSVAVGSYAGQTAQGTNTVAIGNNAGNSNQGNSSINIGTYAGAFCTPACSIVLGQLFFPSGGAGVYISSSYMTAGCGASCTNKTLFYCTSNNKVTYATASGGGGISAGKSIAFTMILGA